MNKEFRDWLESEIQYLEDFEYANVVEFRILRKLERIIKRYDELHKPAVIPKCVADWIEEIKKNDKTLVFAISYIYDENEGVNQPDEEINKIYCWIESYDNDETFTRAWLDGYEVEDEQKYYVLDSEDIPLLEKVGNQVQKATSELSIYEKGRDNSRFKLTEQEIKNYDARFWPFAEPVEQADFRLSF